MQLRHPIRQAARTLRRVRTGAGTLQRAEVELIQYNISGTKRTKNATPLTTRSQVRGVFTFTTYPIFFHFVADLEQKSEEIYIKYVSKGDILSPHHGDWRICHN